MPVARFCLMGSVLTINSSREETSLSGVAQAVVDQVVRLHHARIESAGDRGGVREDITLLIREFGRPHQPRPERRDDKTLTRSSFRLSTVFFKPLYDNGILLCYS